LSREIIQAARRCLLDEARRPNTRARLAESDIYTLADQQAIYEAMSTSDFPVLLADTARAKMLQRYDMEVGPLTRLMETEYVSDFEDHTGIRLTQLGNLLEIGGEFTEGAEYTTVGEEGKHYQVKFWMRRFKLTMKALHTDKLGGLGKLASSWGEIAADSLEQRLAVPFNTNLEQDGTTALFSGARANCGVLPLTQANLEMTISLLRQMTYTDGDGNTRRIKCNQVYLLVPPELELTAWQIWTATKFVPAAAAAGIEYDPKEIWRQYGLQPPVMVPDFTDANRWFVVNASREWVAQVKHNDAKTPLFLQKRPYWDNNVLGYPVDESMCAEWGCAYFYDYYVKDFRTMYAQDSDNPW
jgi:hypothetical protein